jgi:hypothetical protein
MFSSIFNNSGLICRSPQDSVSLRAAKNRLMTGTWIPPDPVSGSRSPPPLRLLP